MSRKTCLKVKFYKTTTGNEPVREWLKTLSPDKKKTIGEDIKTVQFGYPIGMPLVRMINKKYRLEEVRSIFSDGIARVIFCKKDSYLILLHGFIKKKEKTPQKDIDVAITRYKLVSI